VRSKSLFSVPLRSVLLTLSVWKTEFFLIFLRLWDDGGCGDSNISSNTEICTSSYLISWRVYNPWLGSAKLLRKFFIFIWKLFIFFWNELLFFFAIKICNVFCSWLLLWDEKVSTKVDITEWQVFKNECTKLLNSYSLKKYFLGYKWWIIV